MCDEAPRKDDRQRQRLARREEVRQILAAPLARPVPPDAVARPLTPDDAEWARRSMAPICRALRVDPDGPLEPMQPASVWDERRQLEELLRDEDRYVRDAALVRALRFT